jgi:magnesium transporter
MDQTQNPPPDGQTEGPTRSSEELVRAAVSVIRQLLEGESRESAISRFRQLHAVDHGEVLMSLPGGDRLELLAGLSLDEAAGILEDLEPEEAVEMCQGLAAGVLAQILEQTRPDAAADVFQLLPEDRVEQVLHTMEDADEIVSLLQYRKDTAGGLMTLGYPVVRETVTTSNALDQLRLLGPDTENINSILVVDNQGRLVGSLSMTRLALARPTSLVGDIADHRVISVNAETDQEECVRLMERYDLSQLPVVDQVGRLTGVTLAEDMVDVVEEEATEDMYRMAGVAGQRVTGPLANSLCRRLPWLYINLATAVLAALVISFFESTIAMVVVLVVFLPVVAGQGGIGGTQTVTLIVRSMALGEVPRQIGLRLARELSFGLINGATLGVVVGAVAFAWKGIPVLGLVVGLPMLGNMLVGGLAGAGVPLLLRHFRMDPAVSSAVFVTTFTDVIGFLLFLGLAAAFISYLE